MTANGKRVLQASVVALFFVSAGASPPAAPAAEVGPVEIVEAEAFDGAVPEIGRASCRERV